MATYPEDQFDDLPRDQSRIGAHRGAPLRGRGWITFAWAALATGVLVVGGLYFVNTLGAGGGDTSALGDTTTPTATPTPTVAALTDPSKLSAKRKITVGVLNGTTTVGLATKAYKALKADGWPMETPADNATTDVKTTYIYYTSAKNEDVARGIAAALGLGKVSITTDTLGAPVTILLGADYAKAQKG